MTAHSNRPVSGLLSAPIVLLGALLLAAALAPGCASRPSGHGPMAGIERERNASGEDGGGAPDTATRAMMSPGVVTDSANWAGQPEEHGRMDDVDMDAPQATNPGDGGAAADVPTRRDFPETMLVQPRLITDAQGQAVVPIARIPDSITTWKVQAIAHSADGAFGEGSATFRVFKEVFLNLQVPRTLTRGDVLDVPMTVMNYQEAPVTVEVTIQPATWLTVEDEGRYRFRVDAASSNVQYARMTMTETGDHMLIVRANAGSIMDAVQVPVRVEPRGIRRTVTGRVRMTGSQRFDLRFPGVAPANASEEVATQMEDAAFRQVRVSVMPTTLSQMLLARQSLLQEPTGCLEQTLSSTLLDLEVARGWAALGDQVGAARISAARGTLELGVQRLFTFYEPHSGAFGSFPGQHRPQYDNWLTPYALYTLKGIRDLYKVDDRLTIAVDEDLIADLEAWLAERVPQWSGPEQYFALWAWVQGKRFDGTTADVLPPAMAIVLDRLASTPASHFTTYELAILLNVWAELGHDAFHALIDALVGRFGTADEPTLPGLIEDEWAGHTLTSARGDAANIEVAALALLSLGVMAEGGEETGLRDIIAKVLLEQRHGDALWPTTFATAIGYRALATIAARTGETAPAGVTVAGRFNGSAFGPEPVATDGHGALQFAFRAEQLNSLELIAQGMVEVQVTREQWFPDLTHLPDGRQAFDLVVSASTSTLRRGETTKLGVQLKRRNFSTGDAGDMGMWWPGERYSPPPSGSRANPIVVSVGVPGTMRVFTDSLDALEQSGRIDRYELTGREIRLYLNGVPRNGFSAEIELFAQATGTVSAPASKAWEYYNPDGAGYAPPLAFTVAR